MSSLLRAADRPVSLSGVSSQDIGEIVASAQHAADDLRGACVLVTGATGWFGTWLLEGLVALNRVESLGLHIVAVSRRPDLFGIGHAALHAAPEITWIARDVRDTDIAIDAPITHVMHAATGSSATLAAEQPDLLFETIVAGTRNVLACARRHRARRFLFVSSGAVYGLQARGVARLAEDSFDPGCPTLDVYARGKRAAEAELLRCGTGGEPAVSIARCFAFVGPHMPFDTHFAIGNFIHDAMARRPIHVAGDGTPRRSYLYTSDLVAWLLVILARGASGRTYNVGSPHAITIGELAERCAALGGEPLPVVVAGQTGGRDYVPDVGRATGELDLRVRVPLDEAIVRTIRWRMQACASCEAPDVHRGRR